ncbi:HPP family protein [Arcobacter porcinus]|uniref:HPP family protein n=1 Tax=Arcobacter porcinus TaxID=1935204 RepID=A0ABX2YC84_9BACT|nr:HPP family protein [Arcobacter porcinus]OCL92594.1 HPP family protein [Arcobacter porcinus]
MGNYLKKFIGQKERINDKSTLKEIVFTFIGSFIAIVTIGYLTKTYDNLLIMGSFGASCVLLFAFPKSPFSQPRNIIFGHFISSFVGLFFLHFLGNDYISMALALAVAIALMMATKTVHPSAGSNPLIIFLLASNWNYLIFPTLTGAILLVIVGLFYNNLHKNRVYPLYWI